VPEPCRSRAVAALQIGTCSLLPRRTSGVAKGVARGCPAQVGRSCSKRPTRSQICRPCSFSRVRVHVHVCFRQFRTCGVRNVLRTNTDFVLVFVSCSCSCSMVSHVRNDRTHVTFLLQSEGGERTRRKNTSGGVRSFATTEFELFKVNCTKSARSVLEHEHEHEKREKEHKCTFLCSCCTNGTFFEKTCNFRRMNMNTNTNTRKNTPVVNGT